MAMLTLSGLWLHLASDPANQYVHFATLRSASMTPSKVTSRIELAGGRIVTRSRPTKTRRYDATVRVFGDTSAIRATIDAWTGEIVLVRDALGHKLYGQYEDAPMTALSERPGFDIQLTVHEVSFSEAYDPEAP